MNVQEDHVPMLLATEHALINAGYPEDLVHDYLIKQFEPYFETGASVVPDLVLPKDNMQETFVVPVAQMDIGARAIEPTPIGTEPALNARDIPEDTVYFGPYGQWKKDTWFGSNDEERSIYKEPIGHSPNEDQVLMPELQLPEASCPCPVDLAELNEMKLLEVETDPSTQRFHAFTNSSSWVGNVRYDKENQTMRVKMNGKNYNFCNVPQRIYDSFKGDTSPGSFVNRSLKKQYTCPGFSETTMSHIRETISEIRHEFDWLSDDFITKAQNNIASQHGGRLMLIRASAEAITDHRGEGEPYLRKLTGRELLGMARTATGKGSDINHNPAWQTEGVTLDSEYNDGLGQIQLLHYERDPVIVDAIEKGIIDAVSINGGPPRKVEIECDGQCFVVPKGVILGESDGIGFTYVVTHPNGLMWNGNHIPKAKPGVKNTAIQLL